MALLVSGEVPNSILENARPGDWRATLALVGPQVALAVELTGPNANLFEASLDLLSGKITILPAMVFDREAYAASADPVFTFGLRIKTAAGWQTVSQSWSVTLLGLEDAPPRDVFFATGGFVLENDVGAQIGRLQGRDADTGTSKLTYAVAGQDAWKFEIVDGNVLKLRDGYDLLRSGGTTIQVQIEVSDGSHEASFLLDVQVLNITDADTAPAPPPVQPPAEENETGSGPDSGTDPSPSDPGTTNPLPTQPDQANPVPTDPPPTDPEPADPQPADPEPADPEPTNPDPADPGEADPPPATPQPPPTTPGAPALPEGPPAPVSSLQIDARAEFSLSAGITLVWQAEKSLEWADGRATVQVSAGEANWLPPAVLLQELAALWSTAGDDAPSSRLLDEMLAVTLPSTAAGPWLSPDGSALALTSLIRDVLDQQDPGMLHTDSQVLALLTALLPGQTLSAEHFSLHLARGTTPAGAEVPQIPPPSQIPELVTALFDTLLDRAPDAGEAAYWRAQFTAGTLGPQDLAERLSGSAESLARHGNESDAAYAAALYGNAYGGVGDPALLAHWEALLGTQALDRAGLALAVAEDRLGTSGADLFGL